MNKQAALKVIFFFFFVGITLIIYNPFALYFLNDDMTHLPLSSKGIFFQRNSFRPIHDLLLIIEYKLWGLNALGYHLVEWLIHVLCSVLVYQFSYSLLKLYSKHTKKELTTLSLSTASLFSVYAFHSESVLWILGSGASLATVFFLLSAIFYLKRKEVLIYFISSLICFQIGLFTYEAIWVAPIFVGLLSFESVRNKSTQWKKEWIYPGVYFISFLVNLLIRKLLIGELAGTYGGQKIFSFSLKPLLYNGLCLFARSFVPPNVSTSLFAASVVVLALVLIITFRKLLNAKAFNSLLLILIISFLCSLLPVISLGISTHSRESERFLYLPSVFLCLLIIFVVNSVLSYPKMVICFVGVLFYNIYFTYTNARDYSVAGQISKSFYKHFEIESSTDTIVLNGFPRQFNGLPLFRSGFKEGLACFCKIDTSKLFIADEEEMKGVTKYNIKLAKRNFDFSLITNKVGTHKELTLLFDSSYFSMFSFNNH